MTEKYLAYDLVIFGTKGDLARRKLLPSLYKLEKTKKLNKHTKIIGVGRANWNKENYSEMVHEALEKFMNEPIKTKFWNKFRKKLYFCNIDVNYIDHFSKLKKMFDQKNKTIINYLAMPPNTFGMICKGLAMYNLNNISSRIVMEKPIGDSLKSSQYINDKVGKYFKESQIFRIDHYLGKETILNLLAIRFSNSLFIHNWSNKNIDHIQITVSENIGIEGRWGYFDKSGQIRDMVQNHLLQILSIVAMSVPLDLSADSIRDEKVKILKSLKPINQKNIKRKIILGQYSEGYINNKLVPSYLKEFNANIKSNTETFVCMKININNWRWAGVPFYLRTGKRLPIKNSEIAIYFKNTPTNLFKNSLKNIPQNKLVIKLQPDEGLYINIINKVPDIDSTYKLKEIKLSAKYSKLFKKKTIPDAYERLLFDSMIGKQALFVRKDEVEASWKWIDNIINAYKKIKLKPELYPAGTWGPQSSIELLKKDGRSWNIC
ncbi:glucose-6-phosphate dehydrogenase [Buchnera aphidicola (Mollitrichosiphum nigrofasciatum)]